MAFNPNSLQNPIMNVINQFGNIHLYAPNNQITINDFVKISDLGEGRHGFVKQVRYKKDNNIYALKMIPQDTFLTKEGERNEVKETDYLREVAVLKDLKTRNNDKVIKLYMNFEDKDYRYIVTDFVNGKNLNKLREEHQKKNEYIQQKYMINIFRQLLEILIFLHEECFIIHRDIKPENIILDYNNNIKLIDFGHSVYLINSNPELVSRRSFKGSKKYAPPEIIYSKFRNYDYKVDIFSTGFAIYNIMNPNDKNGKTNLPQDTDDNLQRREQKNENEFYDVWFMDLIKKLYSIDPNERPTAREALQLLFTGMNNPRKVGIVITINEDNIGIMRNFSNRSKWTEFKYEY